MKKLIILILLADNLNAATVWLSTNGSDANSGTEASPKLTMSGAMAIANAGDTIKYKDTPSTLYTNKTQMIDDNNGGYKNSITFDLNGCTLRPPHLNSADLVFPIHFRFTTNLVITSSVATKGFVDMTNNFFGCKVTDGAHHIMFTNITLANAGRSHNLLTSPGSGNGNTFVTVKNCINTNAGWNRVVPDDNELHGYYIRTSSNIIEDCIGYIGNPKGTYALQQFTVSIPSSGNIYRRNIWKGGGDAGSITLEQSSHSQVINSLFTQTPGSGGYALKIQNHGDSNLVANNTFYGCVAAVNVGNSGDTRGNRVINNIATGAASSSGAFGVGHNSINTVFSNNLAFANDTDYFAESGATGTILSGNIWSGGANAQFVDAPNGNFHIGATSSAKDTGLALTEFSTDYDLVAWGPSWGMGAYKFVPPSGLPQVNISSSNAEAFEEGSINGTFNISRTGSTAATLLVNYQLAGTAVNGTDYATLTTNRTFAIGQASTNIVVDPLDTGSADGNKTVILNLWTSVNYDLASPTNATMTIVGKVPTSPPPPPTGGGRTFNLRRR